MWILQSDKQVGGSASTPEAPGARVRFIIDVNGGLDLSGQQSIPEGQHLFAPINKSDIK